MTDINEIFETWKEFTGIDPSSPSQTITEENACIHSYNEMIRETNNLGDTRDTILVMENCYEDYTKNHLSFSMADIMSRSRNFMKQLSLSEKLKNCFDEHEIKTYKWALNQTFKTLCENYEISTEHLPQEEQLLLYLQAKNAVRKMECISFRKGKKTDKPWKYTKAIRIYDSINTLLADTAATEFNGITLNAVIDSENSAYSYFCFVIKNGENILMISDRPKENFSRKYCGRSQGRMMVHRIEKYLFPYEILDLKISKYGATTNSTAISDKSFIGGTLSQISPSSGFWVACCLSFLQDRFTEGAMDDAPQVYSGGMVFIQKGKNSTLPVPVDPGTGLSLKESFGTVSEGWITAKNVREEKIKYDHADSQMHHQNDWLVEKYGDSMDENSLNATGNTETDECGNVQVYSFGRDVIGTEEEIRNTRLLIARHNFANQISRRYKKEMETQEQVLNEFYFFGLMKRMDFIRETAIENGEIILTKHLYQKLKKNYVPEYENGNKIPLFDGTDTFQLSFSQKRKENCLVSVKEGRIISKYQNAQDAVILAQRGKDGRYTRSWLTGGPISYILEISVNCPEAIAEILGIDISSLPEFLRHYTPMSRVSTGNPILNDLDPVEFIPNYISSFRADLAIGVSKREAGRVLRDLVQQD